MTNSKKASIGVAIALTGGGVGKLEGISPEARRQMALEAARYGRASGVKCPVIFLGSIEEVLSVEALSKVGQG